MFLRLLDLLENTCFFDANGEGGNGGAGGTNSTDDKGNENKEGDDSSSGEETITLKKSEYEEMLKNKFAEGVRKAQQGKLDDKKDDTNENKNKVNNTDNDILSIKQELELLKAEKIAGKLGIKPDYQEDLVALVRGKGLELTEENLKKEAEKHKEWLLSNDGSTGGVKKLGSTDGETNPPVPNEEEQAKKLFRL